MKRFVFLVGLFLSLFSMAQMPGNRNNPSSMTGRFYGKIVDVTNKGIDAASIVLVQERMDTVTKKRVENVVGGMLTSTNGDFSLENIPVMGRYKLRVTGIGFKTVEQGVAFERPKSADPAAMLSALDKDLGNIKLEIDDKLLSGVTVTSSRPLLSMGIDRKVFNVDKNIVSAGGTAVDVMKNVPSVNVDIDGNVTLRNNAPQVFVDGRPTNLTLEQIPADAIESIEIITNPSAKFDASGGTAGILNIVLKKQKRVGYAGSLRSGIDSRFKPSLGGDFNLRQNKINFFVSGQIAQRKSISEGSTQRTTFGAKSTQLNQTDDGEFNGTFGFGRAGFDYFINNRNTFTVSGTMGRFRMEPNSTNDIYIDSFFNGAKFDSSLNKRATDGLNKMNNRSGQLSFKHIFPKAGREWTADATYSKGKSNSESMIGTLYYVSPDYRYDRSYVQKQLINGENENLVLQTDYVNPINDKSKFEIGARAAIRSINSLNNFFDINGDIATPITARNVQYESKDYVYATYANFSNKIKDFGYQLGLRAESSNYEGNLVNKNQPFSIEFPISLFPSVFLSQKINDLSDLQLNYSRRINRPNFFQLFPFTDYSDTLNISRGNPQLKPEFTNSLELSYSKTFKNRDNFITSLYFKNTNDLITRFLARETDPYLNKEVFVSSFINADRSYVTGLELTSRNKLAKFWDLTSNANFFTSKIDLKDQQDPDQFLSYFIKLNNSFKLPKNFTVQLSADYTSKIISSPGGGGRGGGGMGGFGGGFGGPSSAAQGFIRPNYGVDAALRFEFLKNRTASVSLNMNDIFRTKKYDAHTESPFFVQDVERRRDPQVLRLNFNWRFGKFDASLFKRKNTRAENDVQMEGMQ